MSLLALDLGGTKLAVGIFNGEGKLMEKEVLLLEQRKGAEVGSLIIHQIRRFIDVYRKLNDPVQSIGISVPGISDFKKGTVWAPNIGGWEAYPLMQEVKNTAGSIPVTIESDRTCYIAGELWQGNARGCSEAIFLSVGTGIGAGIITDGKILRGAHGIAGAIGWMALQTPFIESYADCGCFEFYASGQGMANYTKKLLHDEKTYQGELRVIEKSGITAHEIFAAFAHKDAIAIKVIAQCIGLWGMAVANLVSLFNPEIIIMGGGIFGPAVSLIPDIEKEATRWAQPIAKQKCKLADSGLGGDAGLFGAGYVALQSLRAPAL